MEQLLQDPWVIGIGTGLILLFAGQIVERYFEAFRNWVFRNPWVKTVLISFIVASAVGLILEARTIPAPLAQGDKLPEGSVLAFTSPCRIDLGWESFDEANGRFVIGAGVSDGTDDSGNKLSSLKAEETGGNRFVELETKHLPDDLGAISGEIGTILLHSVKTERADRSETVKSEVFVTLEENSWPWATGETIDSGDKKVRATTLSFKKTNIENTLRFNGRGEGLPHKNTPPYIALHFCKKVAS